LLKTKDKSQFVITKVWRYQKRNQEP